MRGGQQGSDPIPLVFVIVEALSVERVVRVGVKEEDLSDEARSQLAVHSHQVRYQDIV